mmetsp:Transcript_26781/g.44902  ORF Transcript_26781/g.44902 Transcript_26781/m.44902 type:complete len:312 (-) Transcript_26781:312-1247(-)|eukprot:CAMPEP_0198219744 /NCGR_PEP_ID=MMETSP1445-20131203/76012_1 /TAXON_ID=36898 /ORGANISM="Pyramimonas sp., Strain CCMP2087" /LENGTH=311 /DNA_ID=CAMNT_0043897271 /DNA_START=90 /DNA_END=1025 /DNA_ORIENTATION=+
MGWVPPSLLRRRESLLAEAILAAQEQSLSQDGKIDTVHQAMPEEEEMCVKSPFATKVRFVLDDAILYYTVDDDSDLKLYGDSKTAYNAETVEQINLALQGDDPNYGLLGLKRHDRLRSFGARFRARKSFLALKQLLAAKRLKALARLDLTHNTDWLTEDDDYRSDTGNEMTEETDQRIELVMERAETALHVKDENTRNGLASSSTNRTSSRDTGENSTSGRENPQYDSFFGGDFFEPCCAPRPQRAFWRHEQHSFATDASCSETLPKDQQTLEVLTMLLGTCAVRPQACALSPIEPHRRCNIPSVRCARLA